MSDLNAFFAKRDGRKPRIYRDYMLCDDAAQSSGTDDLEAQAEQDSPLEEAAQAPVSFQEDSQLSVFQRREKDILDNLEVKTVGHGDKEADDIDDCDLHSVLPRAGFTKKAAAAANWEGTEDSPYSAEHHGGAQGGRRRSTGGNGPPTRLYSTSYSAYSKKSYGRESSSDINAGVDSKNDCSSGRPTRGELGVGTRHLLRGGEGIYRPPMRGSGQVCPPKEDCEEETRRSRAGRSAWLGRKNTRPINVSDALASGGGTRTNNSYGASTGGQRGCERQSSQVDDEQIVVRFTSARSTRMNKKVDMRGISGSGTSASGGCSLESGNCDSSSVKESSSGSGALASGSRGGLPDRRDGTGSTAVCLPRNADAGSTDCSSSGAAGRLPGAVNRLTLRGSGGFYKPPMRGLGEVCPPKEESE